MPPSPTTEQGVDEQIIHEAVESIDDVCSTFNCLVADSLCGIPEAASISISVPGETEFFTASGCYILAGALFLVEGISAPGCSQAIVKSLNKGEAFAELSTMIFHCLCGNRAPETENAYKRIVFSYLAYEITGSLLEDRRRDMLPRELTALLKNTWESTPAHYPEDRLYNDKVIYMFLNHMYDRLSILNSVSKR
jgi:hypothetical protein